MKQVRQMIQLSIPEQTSDSSVVCSVETYANLLHDNVVEVVKSLRSGV